MKNFKTNFLIKIVTLFLISLKVKSQQHDSIHRSWSSAESLRFSNEPGPSQAIFLNTQGLILRCSAVSRTAAHDDQQNTNRISYSLIKSESSKSSSSSNSLNAFSSSTGSSSNVQIQWFKKTAISSSKTNNQLPTTATMLVHNVSNLIFIRPSDNALVFNSFTSENFRPEIHLASYFCMASNHLGSIITKEVQVQAVITTNIQVNVYDDYVTKGSSASLKCQFSSNFKDFLEISAWVLNDGHRIEPLKIGLIDVSSLNKMRTFAIFDQLIIMNVIQEDTFRTYKCEVRNIITNEIYSSATSGKIIITEPNGNTPPFIQTSRRNTVFDGLISKQIILPCLANGNPLPNYRWFYKSKIVQQLNSMGVHLLKHNLIDYRSDREQLIELNMGQNWKYQLIGKTGNIIIKNLTEVDTGSYVCVANNSYGQDQIELDLLVKQKLSVQLNIQSSNALNKDTILSDTLRLRCNILSGTPIQSIIWFYNGIPFNQSLYSLNENINSDHKNSDFVSSLINTHSSKNSKFKITDNGQLLIINKFDSSDQGCYQCMVKGGYDPNFGSENYKSSPNLINTEEIFVNSEFLENNRHRNLETKDHENLLVLKSTDTVQNSICLQLSLKAPILKKVFSKSVLKQGEKLSLRCVANGNPLPTVTWNIFDSNLPENHRIQYGDYVSLSGDVVSYVNISSVQTIDSGLYTCSAVNNAGTVSYSQYIYVSGPLSIKTMNNQTALAGQNVVLSCPVLGYPYAFIRWSKLLKNGNDPSIESSISSIINEVSMIGFSKADDDNHRLIPVKSSERIRVFENGTLIINQLNREQDAGWYRCEVGDSLSRNSGLVRKKMYLNVISKPSVSQFQFPTYLTQGMRIIITCNVLTGDPPIKIDWIWTSINGTSRTIVFNNLNGKLLSDDNIERSDISEVGSSLVFRQVDTSHRGEYTCKASNDAGDDQYTATMTVKSAPKWVVEPKDQSAIVGETVTFQCQADGYPAPLIRWKTAKDNQAEFKSISSNYHIQTLENGSLTIKEVTKADAGFYLCESGNSVGSDLSKVIQLKVFMKAHFKLNFDLYRVQKSSPLRLSCTAYGEKPITIRWLKDRNEINPSSEKRYIVTDKETINDFTSELYSSSASREDSNTFTCVATNAYGQSEQHNRVLIEETPDPPTNIEVAEYNHKSITLRYTQPYNGNLPIIKYICQWKKHKDNWTNSFTNEAEGNTLQITVNDLMPLTSYNFRIYAVNGIGRSEQSQLITVKTDEQAPTSPPTNVRLEPLSAKSVKIKWKQPKHMEQFGSISGYYVGYRISKASNQQFTFSTIELNNLTEDNQNSLNNSLIVSASPSMNVSSFTTQYEHVLNNLKKATSYTIIIQAFNSKGAGPPSAEIQCKTKEKDPPSPPQFRISNVNVHSATISWSNTLNDEEITGYQIFIRGNDWESHEMVKSLSNSTLQNDHTINSLKCGTKYQIYLVAFNEAGNSEPSKVQTFQTLGNVPIAPDKRQLILSNSSSALLKLSSFKSSLCAITSFEIKYKLQQESDWIEINNLESNKFSLSFELIELRPASWYNLIVSAFSEAGTTQVEYLFSTLTSSGATIAPQSISSAQKPNEEQKLKKYIQLMLPICSALIALVVIVVFIVFFNLKRNQNQHNTNSICDALSTTDHHLSQPNLLHLNSHHNQAQQALQHVTHYTLSHPSNTNQLQNKNDSVLNSMLIGNNPNNKIIYEGNINQTNNAVHLQNNDSISNSIYCPSPYATTRVSYFFQDNPLGNCFLMTTPNELTSNNLNQKTLHKNLNHENCYDMPMLKVNNFEKIIE